MTFLNDALFSSQIMLATSLLTYQGLLLSRQLNQSIFQYRWYLASVIDNRYCLIKVQLNYQNYLAIQCVHYSGNQ